MKNKPPTVTRKTKSVVTQALLEEYAELCRIAGRKEDVRRAILALLESGAEVESGRMVANLEAQRQARLTWPKFAAVVGEAEAAAIRADLGRTEIVFLRVGRPVRSGAGNNKCRGPNSTIELWK